MCKQKCENLQSELFSSNDLSNSNTQNKGLEHLETFEALTLTMPYKPLS